ncbi:ribose-phosphate pyrophosphokinase [Paenibacillus sp. FSL H8-0548]|uniref:ribose-phosphate pyrophosphokinase n=1 Tax=Paenibacillus sp. FSL H8-0548 TaxID=1920422 RepID=UPI00096C1EC9|nr:ribose-phosphate pyrophosphokinase [Paenibacillus sp. FSL H8-0548]OMF22053.1 ribose-phosphate pyrophosphokinase [Paenibacillus sp. FSL H8-0548]
MLMLNGIELGLKQFPNGETLVNGDEILTHMADFNTLVWKYEEDGDLVKLMFIKSYLDDRRVRCSLTIYYLPYSRMDRVEGTSAFTLKYTASFINRLDFESVTIIEPHSDVSLALIDRSIGKYPTIQLLDQVAEEVGFDPKQDYLFFPDAGAQKRYSKVQGYKQLVGFKARDFQTGQIKSLEVVGQVEGTGFKVIIVDDLCSYGGTFMLSGEKLKEIGASHIYLLVGHCEKSIYKGKILETDLIDKVFTTNTILDQAEHNKIHVYEIGGL